MMDPLRFFFSSELKMNKLTDLFKLLQVWSAFWENLVDKHSEFPIVNIGKAMT